MFLLDQKLLFEFHIKKLFIESSRLVCSISPLSCFLTSSWVFGPKNQSENVLWPLALVVDNWFDTT